MATDELVLTAEEIKVRRELDEEYAKKFKDELEKFQQQIREENKKAVDATIDEFKKKLQPPTPEDLQKLLNQEYLEFTITLSERKGKEKRTFTIRELPQAIEKRFYTKLKEKLVPLASEIASMSINLLEGDAARKITNILSTFEPMLEVLTYVAWLSLNPYGEEKGIDEAWVAENLSSTRILQLVNVQMECNRMRDFFSLLSQKSMWKG